MIRVPIDGALQFSGSSLVPIGSLDSAHRKVAK